MIKQNTFFRSLTAGIAKNPVAAAILFIFLFQGLFFVFSVRPFIPADENYHMAFTQYYANRPLAHGPFISNQIDNFRWGDFERTPSYLYHYLLSFPLRLTRVFTSNIESQLYVLRLINLGLSLSSLYAIWKILTFLKIKKNVSLAVLFATSFTGMYLWTSSSINYDNLAILLFLSFIYAILKFYNNLKLNDMLMSILLALGLSITKSTFVPDIIFAYVLVFAVIYRKHSLKKLIKLRFQIKHIPLALLVAFVLLFGLVIERYGRNLVFYHSFTPSCSQVHEANTCMASPLYRRGIDQSKNFALIQSSGGVHYRPWQFTISWLSAMYERLFFFFGGKVMEASKFAINVAALSMIMLMVLFARSAKYLLLRQETFILVSITLFYVGLLYLFNLHSYLTSGAKYGFQGRYLLPVLPLIYMLFFVSVDYVYKSIKSAINVKLLKIAIVSLATINIYLNFPLLNFVRLTDVSWQTTQTVGINKVIKEIILK